MSRRTPGEHPWGDHATPRPRPQPRGPRVPPRAPGTPPYRRYLAPFPECSNACCWAYSVQAGAFELKFLTPLCRHWDLRLPPESVAS